MRKNNLTDFGIAAKMELLRQGQTQSWLIGEIRRETGMFLDSAYLCRIFTGQRKPRKIIACIIKILELSTPKNDDGQARW